ncbi:MAG: response regulator transcription factor [Gammaproteobacteria bacterium]|nr:response regulator transcription factor [Gammaproteobacteria bacterium]
MSRISILIAEDQLMLATTLSALLNLEHDMEVVGIAADGAVALELLRELKPDILLTDIEMPVMSGLELAAVVKKELPDTSVIIVTTFARPGYLRRAIDVGAKGYLLKDSPGDAVANAIRDVMAGGRSIDPNLAQIAWTEEDPLTNRERQSLRLAGEGLTNSQIAEELHLNEGTVRNYISETISKLGASNRVDAARIARNKGWL